MDFSHAVSAAASSRYMLAIILLVGLDFVTGVLSAVRHGTFSWKKVGDVIPKNVLLAALTAGAQVFSAIREGSTDSLVIGGGVFYIFTIAIGHSILENIDELTGLRLMNYADALTGWIFSFLKKKPAPTGPPSPSS